MTRRDRVARSPTRSSLTRNKVGLLSDYKIMLVGISSSSGSEWGSSSYSTVICLVWVCVLVFGGRMEEMRLVSMVKFSESVSSCEVMVRSWA